MGVYDRDYMRDPSPRSGADRVIVIVLVLVAAIVLWRWWSPSRDPLGPGDPGDPGPRPKLVEARTVDLGEFEVVSGSVAVSDPCYDRRLVQEGAIALKLTDVATGKWRARVIRHVIRYNAEGSDDVRCGELIAFAAEHPLPEAPAWRRAHDDIGVDSGQAGFFEWRHFHSREAAAGYKWRGQVLDPRDLWYSMCGDVTLHGDHAGTIPFGAVASSGWGDGGYPLHVLREGGRITALRLVFIGRGEYEPAGDGADGQGQ